MANSCKATPLPHPYAPSSSGQLRKRRGPLIMSMVPIQNLYLFPWGGVGLKSPFPHGARTPILTRNPWTAPHHLLYRKHDVGLPQQLLFFSTGNAVAKASRLPPWSLRWGRHVQHHLKKTQVSEHLLALEFMRKSSCLRGFIFYVKGLYYKSHEPHKSDLTPAPWVRLGPIYGEAQEKNGVFYLFYHLAFTRRGPLGELACTGQRTVHKATINPPSMSNPPWVKNLDSTTKIGCLVEDAYSWAGTALGGKASVTTAMSCPALNTANYSYHQRESFVDFSHLCSWETQDQYETFSRTPEEFWNDDHLP